jgi:hypothetical protein
LPREDRTGCRAPTGMPRRKQPTPSWRKLGGAVMVGAPGAPPQRRVSHRLNEKKKKSAGTNSEFGPSNPDRCAGGELGRRPHPRDPSQKMADEEPWPPTARMAKKAWRPYFGIP